jgi:hypothetical protein
VSLLDKLDQYVKLKQWLQFVGYMVAYGGLVIHHPLIAYVGLSVSMAGFAYDLIYP